MTAPRRPAVHRLAAFSLALVMTLGMLGTVNHLATSDPTAGQMARAAVESARG